MKILLLNVQKPVPDYITPFAPLGLAYLAAFAERALPGIEIRIASAADFERLSPAAFDLIGLSSVTQDFSLTLGIIDRLSSYEVPLLLGGVHITLLPACLPKTGKVVAVVGEGEETFVELIRVLQKHRRFSPELLAPIAGIAYRDESGGIVLTSRRPPIHPLDSLPLPDREKLSIKPGGTVYLFSSRGCPYKCVFCASTRLHDRLRLFSAGYVLNEIEFLLQRYRPLHIKFFDDLFVASKSRLREIVHLLENRKIQKQVLFSINATAAMIDEETAKLLRRMNVYSVGMGLESGNASVLSYLKAGQASIENSMRAVELLARQGINPSATFIIGSPFEDETAFMDTLRFLSKSKIAKSYLYLLTPYPGTPLWDYAKEKGLVSEDMDWNRLDINENTRLESRIILSEHLSPEVIQKLFRKFCRVSRRKYIERLAVQSFRRPDLIVPFIKLHLIKR